MKFGLVLIVSEIPFQNPPRSHPRAMTAIFARCMSLRSPLRDW